MILLEEDGVVGPLERAIYDEAELRKFEQSADDRELDIVFQASDVTIYAMPGSDVVLTPDEVG